jgi:YgiT-type zinc finger domain-containing protein
MKCLNCNLGETREGFATVTLERGQATLVFKHVPAQVWANCGEEYIDDAIVRHLFEHAEEALEAGVELDVRQYKAA